MNEIFQKIEDVLNDKFSSESYHYSWCSKEDEEGNYSEIDDAVEEILNDCGVTTYDVTSSDVFDCPSGTFGCLSIAFIHEGKLYHKMYDTIR